MIGSGAPLLLIHGLGAFLESWNPIVPGLARRHTVIAVELPGFGRSTPLDSAYSPDGAAGFVLRFLDALRIDRAVIVGSSLGGAIATLAAAQEPTRCTGLSLAAPAGFGPWVTPAARLATVPLVGEFLVQFIRWYPWLGVRNAFVNRDHLPQYLVEMTRRSFASGGAGAATVRIVRGTVTLRGVRPDVIDRVCRAAARVIAPTLIIWGARDRVVPPAYAQRAAGVLRHAEVLMIEEAGHVPYIEQADVFVRAVDEFLTRTTRPVEMAGRR
jgi:pimeloyl-ACP methyl ester carboxylesterase